MRHSSSDVGKLVAVTGLLLLLVAVPTSATLVLPQNLDAVAGRSTQIVQGTVVSLESHWNDDHTLIVTDVAIQVTETFKGARSRSITLEVVGGQVEALALDVVDSPRFAVNEEVVVFAPAAGGKLRLAGLSQDKYRVERDADGSRWVSNLQYPLAQLVPGLARALDAAGRLPYPAFAERLRATVAGGGR